MTAAQTPIAIVGMACRFSGNATNPDKLWDLLASGKSGWSEIPESRFATRGIHHPHAQKTGFTNVRGGHFLDQDPTLFDAQFFNFPVEVASTMDPQHRLTLEVVYEAMESAGITLSELGGSDTSVYAGCMLRDYHDTLSRDPDTLPRYFMTTNAATMASNRVSHFYDLHGPSMTVDTGCSTTLTALHLACQGLRSGESTTSVVTGASLMLNPDYFATMSSVGFLSPDGKSYAFDDRANGYGRGEGVAALILKRLDDAVAAGDSIRAVIRGTALNQDGKTTTITTPCQKAQADLIRACYEQAGLDPAETAYVEAHGTGTPVGDPVELGAITDVLGRPHGSGPLIVGSVKTAIGHTEAASGLASVIKVVSSIEKGLIAPNYDFQNLNPKLGDSCRNVKIPTAVEPWPTQHSVRRASINNFGFGGANAHLIIEEYREGLWKFPPLSTLTYSDPQIQTNGWTHDDNEGVNGSNSKTCAMSSPNTNAQATVVTANGTSSQSVMKRIFILRAKEEEACRQMATNLKAYLLSLDVERLESVYKDLAYTLCERRSAFPWVTAISAGSLKSLTDLLDTEETMAIRSNAKPRIGFVFNGQGAQWHAMGRELLHTYPVFKESIAKMDEYIQDLGSRWSLLDELYRDEDHSNVQNLVYSLPMTSAVQIALVDLLWSWDIYPTAVTGHSSGEVAAAYAAGAMDARAAIAIPYLRGALSAEADSILGKGGMLAVGLGREKTEEFILKVKNGQVAVACINSQYSVTASGDISGIDELEGLLANKKIFCRRLRINGAFHSIHMSPISEMYMDKLRPLLQPKTGFPGSGVVFSSSVTGCRLEDLAVLATPEYWNANMLGVVEFEQSFRKMCFSDLTMEAPQPSQDIDIVVEVGPHGSLGGPIQDLMKLPEFGGTPLTYFPCLVRKRDAVNTMQTLACSLLREGYLVNLRAVNFPHGLQGASLLHDLPPYPWNHGTRFWMEPRVNKAWRHRSMPSHDLLGTFQAHTNPFAPTWRIILRPFDLPWLRDHIVASKIVFPGAGYISMAIEAVNVLERKQGNRDDTEGYALREVHFTHAMIIPDDMQGREVQLTLQPCDVRSLGSRGWHEFRVFSASDEDKWTEHCNGLIKVEHQKQPLSDMARLRESLTGATVTTPYRRQADPRDLWTAMRAVGICHGPSFQNLKQIKSNREGTDVTFSIADVQSIMPSNHESQYTIHPTTLDSIIQAAYTVLPEMGTRLQASFVPRTLKRLYIGHAIANKPGHTFRVHIRNGTSCSAHSFETNLSVVDNGEDSQTILEIEGLKCQSIDGRSDVPKAPSSLFNMLKWENDPSFPLAKHVLGHLTHAIDPDEVKLIYDLRRASLYLLQDAIESLAPEDVENLEWYHLKLYEWMKLQVVQASNDELGPGSSQWLASSPEERSELIGRLARKCVNGEMLQRIGPRIPDILRRKTTPLELMLEDGLLYRYYLGVLKFDRSTHQMAEVMKLLAHKNPRAKILEIGAGTGGGTQAALDALGRDDDGGALFGRYDFTDISPGFFDAAKKRFEPWIELMTFNKLDIESDPIGAGFEAESYDLIVACQVLHATRNMRQTMSNVRKLLKPGGRLLLIETTQDSMDVSLAFGLLPGWWLSEESERKNSPSLSVPQWNTLLQDTGFTGIDLELRDCEDEQLYNMSVILSTASTNLPSFSSEVVLIQGPNAPPQAWVYKLQSSFTSLMGTAPRIENIESAHVHNKTCVYLADLRQPSTLMEMNDSYFAKIKTMLINCSNILWVSRGGVGSSDDPQSALSHGLLRTLRQEYRGKKFVTLDVDPDRSPWTSETVTAILQVFSATSNTHPPVPSAILDSEFCERNGSILVSRLLRDKNVNKAMTNSGNGPIEYKMATFDSQQRAIRLHIESQGLLDTLVFIDDTASRDRDLLDDYVELDPKAFGLNFRDIMVAMGQIGIDTLRASECSGIITQLGPRAAEQGLKVGDRVVALIQDYWTTKPRVHWSGVAQIQDDLPFDIASAVPVTFVTAYISLHEVAKVQRGESVLIHSAAGGLGQSAIQLCQNIGAEIYVTVGDDRKRNLLIDRFGIPEDHIFSSRDTSFASGLLAKTGGRGVDVVLNSLAGPLLQASFNCLADFGRFVELGKRDFEQNSQLDMAAFRRNTTFYSVDLISWESRWPTVVSRVLREVVRLLEQGVIAAPSPVTTYPISRIKEAFRSMQTGQHLGKIVITADPSDSVPLKPTAFLPRLKADASYVVAGGMGGVGRSICEWLVERGAKHLIVMSRNAREDEILAGLACEVRAVSCDISDPAQLAASVESCADMPAVHGVVQSAMLLRDTVFEQMTAEDFKVGIAPKAQGSWNLHQQFENLDFFFMLSSALGITGSPSQANYTAAGAYQDALAHFRRSQGLPAVCLDLGAVQSVGSVAGKRHISERLAENGVGTIHETEIHQLMDYALVNTSSPQIVTAIEFPSEKTLRNKTWLEDGRFIALQPRKRQGPGRGTGARGSSETKLSALLSAALTTSEAAKVILSELARVIVGMFGMKEVDGSKDLAAHGVDSLVAIELRNWIAAQAGVDLSVLDMIRCPSLSDLTEQVASKMGYVSK